jgi:hypothetical protein
VNAFLGVPLMYGLAGEADSKLPQIAAPAWQGGTTLPCIGP